MLGAVFHAITLLIIVVQAYGTHLPPCHVRETLAYTLPGESVRDTDKPRFSHLSARWPTLDSHAY